MSGPSFPSGTLVEIRHNFLSGLNTCSRADNGYLGLSKISFSLELLTWNLESCLLASLFIGQWLLFCPICLDWLNYRWVGSPSRGTGKAYFIGLWIFYRKSGSMGTLGSFFQTGIESFPSWLGQVAILKAWESWNDAWVLALTITSSWICNLGEIT